MQSTKEITCKCGCGRKKMARTADIKRGWGKFFSKSCKAKHQEKRTGQCAAYLHRKKAKHFHDEHGGIPVFNDKTGKYEGFMDGSFDNTSCQGD